MPAPPLLNSFEGGTDGVTISTSNSGGLSGVPFDAVTGALPVFTNVQAHRSLLGMRIVDAAAVQHVDWTGMGSITTSVWFRFYVWMAALPTGASLYVIKFLNQAGGTCAWLRINTSGQIIMSNAADTGAFTGSVAINTNGWTRIEARVLPSTTVGELQFWMYKDPDSFTVSDTALATSQVLAANMGQVQWGVVGTPIPTTPFTFYLDDLGVSSTGPVGPVAAAPSAPVHPLLPMLHKLTLLRRPGLVFPVPYLEIPVAGNVYQPTGSLTAGTIFSGEADVEYGESGSLTAGAIFSGADVAEHSETGSLTTRALASGTDVFNPNETGSLTAGTILSGADVFNANETGTAPVGTLLSGASEYVPSGPATYNKAGSLTTGAITSCADSFQPAETGSLTAGTQPRGADAYTAIEAGSLTAGVLPSGADAQTVGRSGSLLVDTLLAGISQYVPPGPDVVAAAVEVHDLSGTAVSVNDLVTVSVGVSDAPGTSVSVSDSQGTSVSASDTGGTTVAIHDVLP